jgi:deazaflavin-dependent oxidoreductase (nitroreductase family)
VDKRRIATATAKYLVNPFVKAGIAIGIPPPGVVLLETTGRKSGEQRRTPVGGRVEGNSVWMVAEHGLRAAYVRNIEANPRVRVRIKGRWRQGTAHPLPDDDWRERLRMISRGRPGLRFNSAVVRMMHSTPATIRIDLD